MSDNKTAIIGTCVVVGLVLLGFMWWGAVIFNNSQNIQRDEYYAAHCKKVTSTPATQIGNTYSYSCGGQ